MIVGFQTKSCYRRAVVWRTIEIADQKQTTTKNFNLTPSYHIQNPIPNKGRPGQLATRHVATHETPGGRNIKHRQLKKNWINQNNVILYWANDRFATKK